MDKNAYIALFIIEFIGCQSDESSQNQFTLTDDNVPEYEAHIDHASLLQQEDGELFELGEQVYESVCYNCHGNVEEEGSLPNSAKFWKNELKVGNDPYAMYQVVPHEKVNGQMQGGVYKLPLPSFRTGVMRRRFNPTDGQLYACSMSAWGTQRTMEPGALYRVRYTNKAIFAPVEISATQEGILITFTDKLDKSSVENRDSFIVKTWDLKRTRNYGSDRYNIKKLLIDNIELLEDEQTVFLELPEISPVWQIEISYEIKGQNGQQIKDRIQNTIHHLGERTSSIAMKRLSMSDL